jgi:hypothetical protein
MAFHVFVEGATDATPAGVARLAEAIAKHYGLQAADLLARLKQGRFRVKSNTDRATADQYRRDLQQLGARVVIEEVGEQAAQRPAPAAPPARPSQPAYQSGLAAAFSGSMPAASLGALEQDNPSFSLSSVDGAEEQAPSAAAFAPPPDALPASIGPPPEKAKPKPKAEKPKDVPLDLFAPPDAQGEEMKVDIAADEIEHSARKRASTPAPTAQVEPPRGSSQPLAKRGSQPSIQPATEVAAAPGKRGPLADPRARFVAGVLLAIVIGFLPAHLVAGMREDSAYKEIDNKVIAAQQLVDTPEAYATLDRMRADQLERKQGEQRNAAIIALAIWAAVGGAVAFAWFKKIPWPE